MSKDFWMPDESCSMCHECDSQFTVFHRRHHCRLCGRVFCSKCTAHSISVPSDKPKGNQEVTERVRVCNYCFRQRMHDLVTVDHEADNTSRLLLSPLQPAASLGTNSSTITAGSSSMADSTGLYEHEMYDSSLSAECSSLVGHHSQDNGAIDQININTFMDAGNLSSNSNRSDDENGCGSSKGDLDGELIDRREFEQLSQDNFSLEFLEGIKPSSNESGRQSDNDESLYEIESADLENLDFENNGLLWIPPEAEAQADYREVDFFDDCDDAGEWGYLSSSSSLPGGDLSQREKYMEEHQKAMRNEVDGHIRALITQLLEAENIAVSKVYDKETWLDIITRLSWEAASLLKPDMSKGSGMDPGEYVKVKCLACGSPSDSMVVKGVVCKKNVAHRRMVSKIDSPRLLMVGGALQYQRVSSHLSSFNTLLEQEMDHLKMAVAKIEAHRPDILLVERTISRFAQEYLLAKNISLVLNVKRPLLERIARCTGAQIVPSIDHLESQKHGFCESFRVEKYLEEHGTAGLGGKKLTKTLMFFEGCPIPLGFTILLKGASGDELKKVKHVVRYGVFAAYHLALEASYLADEGASLLELPLKSPIPIALPDKPLSVNQSIFTVPDLVIPDSEKSQGENNHLSSQLPSTVTTYVSRSECSQSSSSTKSKNPILKLVQFDNADSLSEQKYKEQNEKTRAPKEDLPSPISESQSILLSLTTRCVWKGVVCQRAHLLRIKYYRSFDKPLGRFLRDDLFDQSYRCRSCEMPSEAHIRCYTQQKGSLIISVRNLAEFLLPGERESKIWMWHRCLKCPRINGFPPATKRVAMSDATWGLSFGKLLDFSFSSHAAASRVASCGHSLHKDCLRFYGCGQMVACFRYAPINVHSIFLPPPKLEFTRDNQEWILKEANKVSNQGEMLFIEVRNAINQISVESARSGALENSTCDLRKHVVELERILDEERVNFEESLQKVLQTITKAWIDILDINKLRQRLLFQSYIWDQRLIYLSTLNASKLQHGFENFMPKAMEEHSKDASNTDTNVDSESDETSQHMSYSREKNSSQGSCEENDAGPVLSTRQFPVVITSSDNFEAAWIGEGRSCEENNAIESSILFRWASSLTLPTEGFDNLDNSTNGLRVPFVNIYQPIMENTSWNTQQLGSVENYNPVFVSSFRELERRCNARLLLPAGVDDTVLPVYDDEPTSVISYALASPEYQIQVSDDSETRKDGIHSSVSFGSLKSFGSSEESPPVWDPLFYTKAFHAKVSFTDNGPLGMVKYNVICYYAKQFETLRDICCPSELDFIRSLSRCKKWGAQGGKSNVFFAKTLDDRFIIKQVTKTELESFIKFAPSYFKYTSESIISCSPTCLAKILGIYQVTTKHLKGGKESKIDVLVMENLLLKRNFTRLYDLKGSRRSRYNPNSSGVLLDQNLIETMSTSPIFVGNKAKRLLERAVWNDTSFLAAIDVMDYSLIVGVDEEKHELVVGIIDFMRQYTWDKHFETWVKASGLLGGPKGASPTIISPDHYKKRFRKAMTTYFLMVPDQWSPPTIIPAVPFSADNDDKSRNFSSP